MALGCPCRGLLLRPHLPLDPVGEEQPGVISGWFGELRAFSHTALQYIVNCLELA